MEAAAGNGNGSGNGKGDDMDMGMAVEMGMIGGRGTFMYRGKGGIGRGIIDRSCGEGKSLGRGWGGNGVGDRDREREGEGKGHGSHREVPVYAIIQYALANRPEEDVVRSVAIYDSQRQFSPTAVLSGSIAVSHQCIAA